MNIFDLLGVVQDAQIVVVVVNAENELEKLASIAGAESLVLAELLIEEKILVVVVAELLQAWKVVPVVVVAEALVELSVEKSLVGAVVAEKSLAVVVAE